MKRIYSNDRKAPRMKKGEFSKMVVTKELHKRFIKEFPEYKDMSWKDFYNNWLDIASRIRKEAIHNPLGIKLGSYLGELKFQLLPYKFRTVSHKESEKQGEEMINLNLETKGRSGRVKWERRWAVKFNKVLQFYAFDETRELTKLAAEYITHNWNKLRTARVTLGGYSAWRVKKNKK